MEVGARPPGGVLLTEWPNRRSPRGQTEADGTLLGPAGRHALPRTHSAGWFRRKFQNRTSPDQVNVPPPPPTLAANVPTSGGGGGPTSAPNVPTAGGGGDLRPRRTSQRQVGGGDLRRPETSTVGRYVGNVHCRGPTFPFERAFTTGARTRIRPPPPSGCQELHRVDLSQQGSMRGTFGNRTCLQTLDSELRLSTS